MESETSSGSMEVHLPADTTFNLSYDTSSGDFSCDFPLTVTGEFDDKDVRGSVGQGNRELRFSSSSGDLSIKKL